ncbi:MAG TPA: sensor histidine kinase [Solirubrobacteraceae bacterium]|nr:sensor histidine kinase [Solirubrobacteraceae bacterium]
MAERAAAYLGPTDQALPALRRAWLVPPIVIAAVVVLAFTQDPAPSLTGSGLGVSASLAVLIAATATFIWRAETWVCAVALAGLIAASACLAWLQPGGAAEAGMFVAVAVAGMRLPPVPSLLAFALAAAASVPPAVHADRSAGMIVATELGIVAFYLLARFGRSAAEAHEQTRRLLLELQASRHAEAEAAMLRERSRLARDMHDVLAHSLSGLMLQLEGARMLSTQPDPNGQLPPALDRAHHLARAGLEEARRAIAALRDEDLPGPGRLEQLAADFEQDSHVRTSLEITGSPRELDSETSLTLYRVAQEALTNIRKHATPERVEVSLRYDPDGTRLTVRDHAQVVPRTRAPDDPGAGGYGLTGMRERAELLGGSLNADRMSDGFRVDLWIPA